MTWIDELERLLTEATPGPWRHEFSDRGGYDALTGAWTISSTERTVAVVDQADYDKEAWEDRDFRSPEAASTSELIISLRNAAPRLLALARAGELLFDFAQKAPPPDDLGMYTQLGRRKWTAERAEAWAAWKEALNGE